MKKSLPKRVKHYFLTAIITFGLASTLVFAQSKGIPADSYSSAPDPNQLLSFKKIYLEPAQDNVDGAFRQTFHQAYSEVFAKNPRFETVNEAAQADTIVRTRVEKKAAGVFCEISLIINPSLETFTLEKATLPADAGDAEFISGAKKLLKTALKRIPFYGSVSGRDGDTVTMDIGSANGLKVGDIVQIARVNSIKRHPLLKSILDIDMLPVGSVELENVEPTIAFGKIQGEIPGEKILRGHKITSVDMRNEDKPKGSQFPDEGFDAEGNRIEASRQQKPEIGYVGLGPFLGWFSSSSSQNNGAVNRSGTAFNPGVKLISELWLTKNWFLDLGFGFGSATIQMQDDVTQTKSATFNTSTQSFDIAFGYKHYIWNVLRGPYVFGKLGYGSFKWVSPIDSGQLLGPKIFSGVRLGVGGALPFKRQQSGLTMGLNLGLFPTYTESGFTLSPDLTQDYSATIVQFNLGFYNYLMSNLALRVGFHLDIYSVEFSGGTAGYGTSTSSQKQIGFLPALLYYF